MASAAASVCGGEAARWWWWWWWCCASAADASPSAHDDPRLYVGVWSLPLEQGCPETGWTSVLEITRAPALPPWLLPLPLLPLPPLAPRSCHDDADEEPPGDDDAAAWPSGGEGA